MGWPDIQLSPFYVADYIDPLLFFFKWTQQITPLTTRRKPWRLRAGRVQRSSSLIGEGSKTSDGRISWALLSQGLQNLSTLTTKEKIRIET